MELSREDHFPRFRGNVKEIAYAERPLCGKCLKPMRIATHTKLRMTIGVTEDYASTTTYYWCGNPACSALKQNSIHPGNPHVPPDGLYGWEVIVEVCVLRWSRHCTYEEITAELATRRGIGMSLATVERFLKTYEIACEARYRPEYIAKIQRNGGIILAIDGIDPLKGEKGIYGAHDMLTGLPLGAKKLPNQKQESIAVFLRSTAARVERELHVQIKGIISDAHRSQRLAIEEVFPGVPHCLCHFHFYRLVLKAPMALDSHLLTATRAALRKLFDLRRFEEQRASGKGTAGGFLGKIIEALLALSDWSRRPKDPVFTGLEMYGRVKGILSVLQAAVAKLDSGAILLAEGKAVRRLSMHLEEIIGAGKAMAADLARIKVSIADLKDILGDLEASANTGLKRLRTLRNRLRKARLRPQCGQTEREFAEALMKFVGTKGELLFNYKLVEGAPTTNNGQELKIKQLKHFLRRVIGHAAASSFLLAHGERLLFVNPKENASGILEILRSVDYCDAQKRIAAERNPRNCLPLLVHRPEDWDSFLRETSLLMEDAEQRTTIIN